MNDIVAMIQARMGSTRLPGKVMMPLAGEPALWRVIERVRAVLPAEQVWVLTSFGPENNPIRKLCLEREVSCYSGSEDDVLERYMVAREVTGADRILRITADCPMVDPETLERLIRKATDSKADYAAVVTGAVPVSYARYPDGFDAELITGAALEYADTHTRGPDREHVTPILWREPRPLPFCLVSRIGKRDLGNLRLTVDTQEDYDRAVLIYNNLHSPSRIFGLPEILAFFNGS